MQVHGRFKGHARKRDLFANHSEFVNFNTLPNKSLDLSKSKALSFAVDKLNVAHLIEFVFAWSSYHNVFKISISGLQRAVYHNVFLNISISGLLEHDYLKKA